MTDYSNSELTDILYNNMDAIFVASSKEDSYRSIKYSDIFSNFVAPTGSYKELLEVLWFRLNNSTNKITDNYQVFLPKLGQFKGKFAQKASFEIDGATHIIQIFACPIKQNEGEYIIALCDLDESELKRDVISEHKVKTIQETYLFSMYVDLNLDLTSSINVTEISNTDLHYDVKYSEWRNVIINMFLPEDQAMFTERSAPEYLREHLMPGKALSFDCQMMNLEGEFIWVKLIWGRTDTTNKQDFRFVFMVQNIHEDSILLFNQLKKFENLASHDALTGVYNHGRIETELSNAIGNLQNNNSPVSLMMFDIDHFKEINDTYGHAVGDEVLKEFINNINNKIQSHNIKMGRWGGEEFVCVCYDYELDSLTSFADEIRQTVENTTFDTVGSLTCSVGVTDLRKEDTSHTAFVRLDEALYRAKSSGRNCVRRNL